MSDMPPETRSRLFKLRCRSKRGEYLPPEEVAFLDDCWKRWPVEYSALGSEVFRETAPFGSQADGKANQ